MVREGRKDKVVAFEHEGRGFEPIQRRSTFPRRSLSASGNSFLERWLTMLFLQLRKEKLNEFDVITESIPRMMKWLVVGSSIPVG